MGWMTAAGTTLLPLLAAGAIALVRLDRRIAEELRPTDEDRRWNGGF